MAQIRKDKKNRNLRKGEYQYPNGRYEYSFTDATGNKQKVYSWCLVETDKPPKGKTCDKCLRLLEEEITEQLKEGVNVLKAKKIIMNDLFDKYVRHSKKRKEHTRASYCRLWDYHISPVFGKRKVNTISWQEVSNFYFSIVDDKKLSIGTLERINAVLQVVFRAAVQREKVIAVSPAAGVLTEVKQSRSDVEEIQPTIRKALTDAEKEAFMAALRSKPYLKHWIPMFVVFLGTGLRVGELGGLTWNDIDFEKGVINVNHSLASIQDPETGNYYYAMTTPKTKAGIREIPMLDDVRAALLEEKARQEKKGGCKVEVDGFSGFVFMSRDRTLMNRNLANDCIYRIVKMYNEEEETAAKAEGREPFIIPRFSAHCLRHTFCVWLCEHTTNIKLIQQIMGHSDIRITMNIYNEITSDKQKEAFEKLNSCFKA